MSTDFIETNILIGSTVDWDNHWPVVSEYLELAGDAPVYLSPRSIREAKSVVNDRKRWVLQSANAVFSEFESSGREPNVDDIQQFVHKKLSQYDVRNRVKSHVRTYVDHNEIDFKGLVEVSSDYGFDQILAEIRDDFDEVLDVLDEIRRGVHGLPYTVFDRIQRSYDEYYSDPDMHSRVATILPDATKDRDLILDAYELHVSGTVETDVRFVTTDSNDILSKAGDLASALGCVAFVHPREAVDSAKRT